MDNTIDSILSSSSSVLILLPTKPYFDQVAAGLALYLSLKDTKDVTISSPSPMTVEFNRLVGVNKIKAELGNKNLVIKFNNYDGKQIERVSADIENGLFQLTVIPKNDSTAPRSEQIEMSYSGIASETVILIGGISESHFPILASNQLTGTKILHIGTRPMVLKDASSFPGLVNDVSGVSELVASIVSQKQVGHVQGLYNLSQDVATNLLMGIEVATDSFSSQTATADTFYYISELMRAGGQRNQATLSPNNFPPGAIPGAEPKLSELHSQPQRLPGSNNNPYRENKRRNNTSFSQKKVQEAPKDWLDKPKIYKGGTGT